MSQVNHPMKNERLSKGLKGLAGMSDFWRIAVPMASGGPVGGVGWDGNAIDPDFGFRIADEISKLIKGFVGSGGNRQPRGICGSSPGGSGGIGGRSSGSFGGLGGSSRGGSGGIGYMPNPVEIKIDLGRLKPSLIGDRDEVNRVIALLEEYKLISI